MDRGIDKGLNQRTVPPTNERLMGNKGVNKKSLTSVVWLY